MTNFLLAYLGGGLVNYAVVKLNPRRSFLEVVAICLVLDVILNVIIIGARLRWNAVLGS